MRPHSLDVTPFPTVPYGRSPPPRPPPFGSCPQKPGERSQLPGAKRCAPRKLGALLQEDPEDPPERPAEQVLWAQKPDSNWERSAAGVPCALACISLPRRARGAWRGLSSPAPGHRDPRWLSALSRPEPHAQQSSAQARCKLAAGRSVGAGALEPTPTRSRGSLGLAGKPRGPLGLPERICSIRRGRWTPEHPPRRRSSLRASSASSRSPPADSRLGPSSPRASMGPAARRRRNPAPNFLGAQPGHGLSGPGPASELLPERLGAAPAGRPGAPASAPGRAGRLGAGPRGGAGPGVAAIPGSASPYAGTRASQTPPEYRPEGGRGRAERSRVRAASSPPLPRPALLAGAG